jgi:hypothetical protein
MTKALAVVVLAAVAAGTFVWLSRTPEAAPVPLVRVQGTSFDVPLKPAEPAAPKVNPAAVKPEPGSVPSPAGATAGSLPPPVAAALAVTKVESEPKPVPPPAEAKPEPKPVVAQVKPEPAPEVQPPPVEDKPLMLTFSKLAFRYWPQTKDKGARDPFPKEIKALNGKKVIMDGFMFPIDFEKGKVRSFILSNGMFGCCFGDAPAITETIKVFRADGKLMPYQSMARVTGILEVGEDFDADGYVDSVYRIKADDVGAAQVEHR